MQRCKSGLAVLLVFVLLVPISGSTADYEEWYGDSATVGGPSKDGVEIQIDLPASQHVRNFGAPADGLGLCVFASMTMDAHWHNVRELSDLMYWDENGKPHSKIRRGGGWPDKVDQAIRSRPQVRPVSRDRPRDSRQGSLRGATGLRHLRIRRALPTVANHPSHGFARPFGQHDRRDSR